VLYAMFISVFINRVLNVNKISIFNFYISSKTENFIDNQSIVIHRRCLYYDDYGDYMIIKYRAKNVKLL